MRVPTMGLTIILPIIVVILVKYAHRTFAPSSGVRVFTLPTAVKSASARICGTNDRHRATGRILGSNAQRRDLLPIRWSQLSMTVARCGSQKDSWQMNNQVERWKKNSKSEPRISWLDRSELIAHLIRPTEVVCDLGAGAQTLRRFLPASVGYIPVDCVDEQPGTWLADSTANSTPKSTIQRDHLHRSR